MLLIILLRAIATMEAAQKQISKADKSLSGAAKLIKKADHMCMCVYTCVYVYIYIHINKHIYIYIYKLRPAQVRAYDDRAWALSQGVPMSQH